MSRITHYLPASSVKVDEHRTPPPLAQQVVVEHLISNRLAAKSCDNSADSEDIPP